MSDEKMVKQIIKKYGPVINLKENPEMMIEILRGYRPVSDDPGDGGAPGGTPKPPPPTSFQSTVSNDDLMKEVLKLSKTVNQMSKQMGTAKK